MNAWRDSTERSGLICGGPARRRVVMCRSNHTRAGDDTVSSVPVVTVRRYA